LKSKVISSILVIAVVLAAVSVPIAVPGVALASNNVTVSIDNATTYVLLNDSFTIDAVINNPDGMDVCIMDICLDFYPTYFNVTSVTKVDFPEAMGPAAIDNVNGTVDYTPHMPMGTSINSTTIIAARITCTATAVEGTSTVSWVYDTPYREPRVMGWNATDYLEGGNMSLMFNGTVEVASAWPIYVPDDYTKIQWAVDNATSGDTIIVRDGTYHENVDVDVAHLTIQSENGTANCVVNATNPDDHVFHVTADWVNITGFTVENTTEAYNAGIYISTAAHCNVSNNNVMNNYHGIYLDSSSSNTVTNNTASSNHCNGIYLYHSSNNTLANNTASSNNWDGIYLYSSDNNTLTSNNASNNYHGIYLDDSSNNTLTNDTMSGNDYNFYVRGSSLSHYIQKIDTSNKVDGKPIYYWVNHQDEQVPSDAGYVGIVNSTNIIAQGLTLTNNSHGVLLAFTKKSKIENVTALNNRHGIYLYHSNNNTLANNTASSNNLFGICLSQSDNNTLTNNTASNNYCPTSLCYGIRLSSSSNNKLTNNTASNNGRGIYLSSSSNNTLMSNTVKYSYHHYNICLASSSNNNTLINNTASNSQYGINVDSSNNNTLRDNTASSNWVGICLSSSSNNTLTNNTASDNGADGIYLSSSSNNTLRDNTASNNTVGWGISLYSSSDNNMLSNNTASNNWVGIYLSSSSNNTLMSNTANSNNDYGIFLYYSGNNTIYNNYFDNTNNTYDNGNNTWNTTKTLGTNIIGGPYLGGNYWSDYNGSDTNGDGFGDTPYNIPGGSNKDYLPLMVPSGATLEVHVSFTGRGDAPDSRWIEDFVVRFFQNGNETPWSPMNATTDDAGVFAITSIIPGTYDISIKNWTCLSALMPNVVLNADVTTYAYFGTTREGDANNNDRINILDLSALGGAFDSSEGGPDWNAHCDFNRDGNVNILDLSALGGNFGLQGDLA